MITVSIPPNWESWRKEARALLEQDIPPQEILWQEDISTSSQTSLFSSPPPPASPQNNSPNPKFKFSRAFYDKAEKVACFRDPKRWNLLYRLIWRMSHGEPHLLKIATDPDVHQFEKMRQAVSRDMHKMRAFVRFHQVDSDDSNSMDSSSPYIAWFEPAHYIVRLNASFFQKRFTSMNWSILTPDLCCHWDGQEIQFSEGIPLQLKPKLEDDLNTLWKEYYRSIYNPARLKIKAMQTEMPKKYWKNLPEADLIEELIQEAQPRTQKMIEKSRSDKKSNLKGF